ncbi:MAG: carboxypeptidase regulatory-like domain-containing protein [Halanaeroarchaeum sp.]
MRFIGVLLSLLVVGSVLAGAPGVASAQSEVTLTVSVSTTDGDAVGGATLAATWDDGSTEETTASNGKAFVDVPEGANVSIAVSHANYTRNGPVEVPDASAQDVEITVAEKGTATIRVRDDDGAVDDARVVLEKDGTTVLDAETTDGRAQSDTIEEGTYDLSVTKSRYYETVREIVVENDTTERVRLERGSVTLTVNVTDDYFEPPRPVPSATVDIEDVGSVMTQSDGTQQVNVPVNSELDVTVSKDGYDSVDRVLTVEESPANLSVDVDRSAALHVETMSENVVVGERVLVTVTDEYDDPVSDADVFVGEESVATTGEDGTATVRIESAGEQSITASKNATTSEPVTVNGVATGDTTTTATTTQTTTGSTTTAAASGIPDISGDYIPLVIVGVLLIVVLLGIRSWQQG